MNTPEGRLYTGSFNSSLIWSTLRKEPPAVCEGSLQPSISQYPFQCAGPLLSISDAHGSRDFGRQERSCRSYQGHSCDWCCILVRVHSGRSTPILWPLHRSQYSVTDVPHLKQRTGISQAKLRRVIEQNEIPRGQQSVLLEGAPDVPRHESDELLLDQTKKFVTYSLPSNAEVTQVSADVSALQSLPSLAAFIHIGYAKCTSCMLHCTSPCKYSAVLQSPAKFSVQSCHVSARDFNAPCDTSYPSSIRRLVPPTVLPRLQAASWRT